MAKKSLRTWGWPKKLLRTWGWPILFTLISAMAYFKFGPDTKDVVGGSMGVWEYVQIAVTLTLVGILTTKLWKQGRIPTSEPSLDLKKLRVRIIIIYLSVGVVIGLVYLIIPDIWEKWWNTSHGFFSGSLIAIFFIFGIIGASEKNFELVMGTLVFLLIIVLITGVVFQGKEPGRWPSIPPPPPENKEGQETRSSPQPKKNGDIATDSILTFPLQQGVWARVDLRRFKRRGFEYTSGDDPVCFQQGCRGKAYCVSDGTIHALDGGRRLRFLFCARAEEPSGAKLRITVKK